MINAYNIYYGCPKCGRLQIIGELVNFGTTDQDLDGKTVMDAYYLGSHSRVPQNILDLLQPNLRCKSCYTIIGEDLTAADLIVKRA